MSCGRVLKNYAQPRRVKLWLWLVKVFLVPVAVVPSGNSQRKVFIGTGDQEKAPGLPAVREAIYLKDSHNGIDTF